MVDELTPEELARKRTAVAIPRDRAEALHIEQGQVWEHIGFISLMNRCRVSVFQ